MNQVVLMGRLTRDPELRRTQSGTAVTSFTIAVDRGFKDSDGERKTDFIDCVAWKGTGEFISKYFTKGQMMAVIGSLQIRDWTDKDGNKRRSAEVLVNRAYFTGNSKNDYTDNPTVSHDDLTPVSGSEFAEMTEDDGDIPF